MKAEAGYWDSYCCTICQKPDWKYHKIYCKQAKAQPEVEGLIAAAAKQARVAKDGERGGKSEEIKNPKDVKEAMNI